MHGIAHGIAHGIVHVTTYDITHGTTHSAAHGTTHSTAHSMSVFPIHKNRRYSIVLSKKKTKNVCPKLTSPHIIF